MSNWKKVYSSEFEYRAKIVNDILEEAGLNPVMLKKRDSSYNNFGNHEVKVNPDHVILALKIIADEIDFRYV